MSKKILLVEDNEEILYANRVMLELEGYDILIAQTAKEGKKLAREETPDLIVLDVMLPDADGIKFCEELQKEGNFRILFLSALGTAESTLRAMKAGGYGYVSKPYLMQTLLQKIEESLNV